MKKINIIILLMFLSSLLNASSMEGAIMESLEADKKSFEKSIGLFKGKRYKEALNSLSYSIEHSRNNLIVLQSKLLYSTIVLDNYFQDEKAISTALEYMLPLALKKKLPEYDFLVANLFFLKKEYDTADVFLQKACTAENVDPVILRMCTSLPHVQGNSLQGAKDSCGAEKFMR